MSIQLQLALPLFVAAAALVLIAVLRKYRKPEVFILCLAMVGLGVLSVTAPELPFGGNSRSVSEIADSEVASLILAQRYMYGGEYAQAEEILEDLQQVNAEDAQIRLAMARCKLLRGDYASAVLAYQELGDAADVKEETEMAVGLYSITVPNQNLLIQELQAAGMDPAQLGLTAVTTKTVTAADAKKLVLDRVKKTLSNYEEEYGEDLILAAKRALAISEEFTRLSTAETVDTSKVNSGVSGLEEILAEKTVLRQNKHLRMALLKGYVLQCKYEKIAAMVDESSGIEELIVAVDLYIGGDIEQEDFSEAYLSGSKEQRARVLGACREALSAAKEKMSDEDYEIYRGKVNDLQAQMEDPAAHNLKEQLVEQTQKGNPGMRSKGYLALARLEQNRGNEKQADAYISDALGTASISTDLNYREPMVNMLQIVQGSSDSSEVKNTTQYAQQAMDHSLPLDLNNVGSTKDKEKFVGELGQNINESTAKMNIGSIDVSKFPEISARVQIQSDKWQTMKQIHDNLLVYDCNGSITDFRLEKIRYEKARIILLCDVSGSMSDSVDDMKNAVIAFAQSMQEGEEVCVVGFDNAIQFVHEFSGDPAVVAGYADSLYAGGGTALYPSLLYCEQLMTADIKTNNIIIAMTDGQDGYAASENTMKQEIGRMVDAIGATVYTVGLGDVDTTYLQNMAASGNGSFLYAETQDQLADFYDFIHGQLRHQYVLTYTAQDQTSSDRVLEIGMKDEMCSAKKPYTVKFQTAETPDDPSAPQEPENTEKPGSSASNPLKDFIVGLLTAHTKRGVTGLNVRTLAQTGVKQTINLNGKNFKQEDAVTVRLIGTLNYNLEATFVDAGTYTVVIPDDIGYGTYDLEVVLGEERFVLKEELEVINCADSVLYQIGSYWFVSDEKRVAEDGSVVLSGNVVMNGWLRFKGEVSMRDDADYTHVTSNNRAYVTFSNNAQGLAKRVKGMGISLDLGRLGTFKLSKEEYDPDDREEFAKEIDELMLVGTINASVTKLSGVAFGIYPDTLVLRSFEMNLDLPLLEQLFSNLVKDDEKKKLEAEGEVLVNSYVIGISGKLEYTDNRKNVKVGKLPIYVEEFSVEVDTLRENYEFALQMKFTSICKKRPEELEGFGGSIAFKGGRFDAFSVNASVDIPVVTTPVPVSFTKIGFGISGFASDESDHSLLRKVLNKTFEVEFEMDIADVTDLLPDVADFLGISDVPLIAINDAKMEVCLGDFKWGFSAEASFLDKVKIGQIELAIGKYDYKCSLLGFSKQENFGMHAAITQGIFLEADDLKLEISAGGALDIGVPVSSVSSKNEVYAKWGILEGSKKVETVIGLFINNQNKLQFSIKVYHLIGIDIVRGQKTVVEWFGDVE